MHGTEADRQEIARLEREVEALNRRLLEAEKSKSHFVSHVLNEINNPLSAIYGLAVQLLGIAELNRETRNDYLGWIRDEAAYLEFQMKNVYTAAELESGIAQPNVGRVDVCAVINRVLTVYLGLAWRKQLNITINGAHALCRNGGEQFYLHTDGAMFATILANLLDNAVKYTPQGGSVSIEIDCDGPQLRLVVEDDGPGVPAEQRADIVARFWQGDQGADKAVRGLGLGLAVVDECAALLGGRLLLVPASNNRCRFEVELPDLDDHHHVGSPEDNVFFFEDDSEMLEEVF